MHRHRFAIALVVAGALTGIGCADEFPAYNFIDGFRVLSVVAADPALEPGATTRLEALVTPSTPTATVTYAWSWCPFSTGSAGAYECAVTREDLEKQIEEAAGFPVSIPSFDLGTTSSVAFTYPGDALVFKGICDAIAAGDVPTFVELPKCNNSFPIVIRVDASDGSDTISAFKNVDLLFEPDPNRNTNPVTTKLSYRRDGVGELTEILANGTTELIRGQDYELQIELGIDQAEEYEYVRPEDMMTETRRETLTFTWFISAGETDSIRTGFIDGEIEITDAVKNTWSIPRLVDYDGDTAFVVVVIRDGRNGQSWIRRTVRLKG